METIKYIVKRLLLAVLILLGVSVIIYGLSRMMPTDFVDQQFAGAIQQGTMSQEDLDRIKELYGLNMPDAYLEFTPGEGSKYSGKRFTKNTKKSIYEEDVLPGGLSYASWYVGTYRGDNDIQLHFQEPNALRFDANGASVMCTLSGRKLNVYFESGTAPIKTGNYEIPNDNGIDAPILESTWIFEADAGNTACTLKFNKGNVSYTAVNSATNVTTSDNYTYTYCGTVELGVGKSEVISSAGDEGEDNEGSITVEETFEADEPGVYEVELSDEHNVIVTLGPTKSFKLSVKYREANFWDKAGSVLSSYFKWLGNLCKGDLGVSFKYKMPVGQVIVENMGISFAIAFIATILQFAIAIPLGIKAAVNQYGVVDYTVTIFTMIGISLPTFFLAAIVIRVFAVGLGWFEVGGLVSASLVGSGVSWIVRLGDVLWHMVLPMFVLVVLSIGGLMRYTRTNTLEALNADYVRTARAKGLSEKTVIYKHAFRNTLVPLVTLLAGTLPSLFGGAMITETVFAIPGIGKLAYDALVVADVPFIMGYNMFLAIMTVLGTLLSDLMYAVVDPRVKIGK